VTPGTPSFYCDPWRKKLIENRWAGRFWRDPRQFNLLWKPKGKHREISQPMFKKAETQKMQKRSWPLVSFRLASSCSSHSPPRHSHKKPPEIESTPHNDILRSLSCEGQLDSGHCMRTAPLPAFAHPVPLSATQVHSMMTGLTSSLIHKSNTRMQLRTIRA